MESFIGNNFFQNPFGGEMKSISGMGGEGGVLENIQQQVADNGEALQALQGGIGGLPNTPFQPAIKQPISYKNPGDLPNPLDFNPPPSITDAASDIDSQLRAEYDELVASAKKTRDEGFMGRITLPGENLSFEEFKKMQVKPGSPFDMLGGPMQSDIFNIAKAEQNPGMDYSQFTPMIGNLYNDTDTGPTVDNLDEPREIPRYVPTDIFGVNGQQGFLNQESLSEPYRLPTGALRGGGMDPLFGRAFAGKPI